MIKTILVPVDGSDHAGKALSLASDLAAKYRARIILLHALLWFTRAETLRRLANRRALSRQMRDLLDSYESDLRMAMEAEAAFVPVPAPRELLEAIGRQILDRAMAAAKKAGVKKVAAVMVGGDPADAILERAKREKADMIVLGSRGLGDFKGLMLGSVSHKVGSRAACTCVTVK